MKDSSVIAPAATDLAESTAIMLVMLRISLRAMHGNPNVLIYSCLGAPASAHRWLHELRIGDYGGASAALAQLADNQQHGDAEVARLRALQASYGAYRAAALLPLRLDVSSSKRRRVCGGVCSPRACVCLVPCPPVQKLAALAACPQWPLAAPEGMDVGFDMQA